LSLERAHRDFLDTRTFASLDGLRAFAVTAVVWHHTTDGLYRDVPLLVHGLVRGFLGVDLFFVISGFLIVTLLLRERCRTGSISLSGFYARRFLRIFPLYYGVLAFVTVVAFARDTPEALLMRADLPWCALYLSNWVPVLTLLSITWSLSAEEQFYLVWPALERFLGRFVTLALALAVVAAGALQLLHAPLHLDALPSFLWQTSFFPILLGVALAHLLNDPRGFAFIGLACAFNGASAIYGAVIVVLAFALPMDDIAGLPRMAIHVAMSLFLASCVVRPNHALRPLLQFAPIARVGVLSYGIYLLHMFARHIAHKLTGDGPLLFPATFAVVVVLAEISYRFYESKFLELKKRFAA